MCFSKPVVSPVKNGQSIRNEWVRLQLAYKIEFKHIPTLLSHTSTCRCLWAGTHTHTHTYTHMHTLYTPLCGFHGNSKRNLSPIKDVTLCHYFENVNGFKNHVLVKHWNKVLCDKLYNKFYLSYSQNNIYIILFSKIKQQQQNK